MKDPEYSNPIYQLNDLASRRNILIVISSHLNKNQQGERDRVTKHCVMGTPSQVGACSDICGLLKERNPQFSDHFVLGCLGKRNCDESQLWNLQGSPEDYSWLLHRVGEYDGDGFQEIYWSKVDNTAYLRAVMHADGNIQYTNYQNLTQMTDYLTSNGFAGTVSLIA